MKQKKIQGAWQKRVYKALLKRRLKQRGETAAKTAEQEKTPAHTNE